MTRVRPFNNKEIEMGVQKCLEFAPNRKDITLNMSVEAGNALTSQKFTFDRVFDQESNQKEVYELAAKPIIESVLDGFNGTIFAYG